MKKTLSLLMASALTICAIAQDGYPDPSFGTDGLSIQQPGNSHDVVQDVYTLENGQILIAGVSDAGNFNFDAIVGRLNSDGTLDTSFGTDGWFQLDMGVGSDYFYEMVVDETTGKITLCGAYSVTLADTDPMIVRLNADGSLDTSFSDDGIFTTVVSPGEEYLYSMKTDGNGNLYACGSATMPNFTVRGMILQVDNNGNLVSSFGTNGLAYSVTGSDYAYYNSLCLSENASIVVAGYVDQNFSQYMLVSNFSLEGDVVSTFAVNGNYISEEVSKAYDVVNQGSAYLVCGSKNTFDGINGFVMKLDASGAIDESFGFGGSYIASLNPVDVFLDLKLAFNGRIIAVGSTGEGAPFASDFLAVRLTADGTTDGSFGSAGISIQDIGVNWEEANAVDTDLNNNVLVAGFKAGDNNDMAIMRLGPFAPEQVSENTASDFVAFPNPFQESFIIRSTAPLAGKEIRLTDSFGRMIYQSVHTGISVFSMPGDFPDGIYFLSIGEESQIIVKGE